MHPARLVQGHSWIYPLELVEAWKGSLLGLAQSFGEKNNKMSNPLIFQETVPSSWTVLSVLVCVLAAAVRKGAAHQGGRLHHQTYLLLRGTSKNASSHLTLSHLWIGSLLIPSF